METAARTDKTATGEWLSPPGCCWSPSDTRPSCLFQHSRRRHHMLSILHAACCSQVPFSRQPVVIQRFKQAAKLHRSIAEWCLAKNEATTSKCCDWCGEPASVFSIDDTMLERRTLSLCNACNDGQQWTEEDTWIRFESTAGIGRDRRSGDHPCDPTIGDNICDD